MLEQDRIRYRANTPETFRHGRESLGMSRAQLAELFGLASYHTIRNWEVGNGQRGIPGPARVLMEWLIRDRRPIIRKYRDE